MTLSTTCFNGHPPLGVNATSRAPRKTSQSSGRFNGHPPLGVNATLPSSLESATPKKTCLRFNGHPPLGVNATTRVASCTQGGASREFQWAPTLGGECYSLPPGPSKKFACERTFQWAPTLGGECYPYWKPLIVFQTPRVFQWAPTLGGECYGIVYLITPPLCQGVNALLNISPRF